MCGELKHLSNDRIYLLKTSIFPQETRKCDNCTAAALHTSFNCLNCISPLSNQIFFLFSREIKMY